MEFVVDLLLRLHEVLVVPDDLKAHQILGDYLLCLDRVEVLLVGDKRPCGFFGVLELLELDQQNVFQLFEVLTRVLDKQSAVEVQLNALYPVLHVGTQLLDVIVHLRHDALGVIDRKRLLHLIRPVLGYEVFEFDVALRNALLDFIELNDDLLPVVVVYLLLLADFLVRLIDLRL